jgi:methionyl-tRNA formyltransferase
MPQKNAWPFRAGVPYDLRAMPLKVVFMGSDAFAVPAVEALHGSGHDLAACVTQPDRPQGRRLQVRACPVKARAEALGVATLTPEKVGEAIDALAALAPDAIVVAAYGQYLPRRLLALPRLGAINIHPSLLPAYRGAAPIQWAVANGDTGTGVTILEVSPRMDAGPILLQERHPIAPDDTTPTLEARLSALGARLMLDALALLERGAATRTPQDESRVSWARKLEKGDGLLDWTRPAVELHNRVRGFQPWPGTYCRVSGQRLGVLKTEVEAVCGAPGTILAITGAGPLIACGEGSLRLLSVHPEGRKPVSGADYLRGARPVVGATFF